MAIHTEQVEEIEGIDKEIDQGAIGLILDNLQLYQYEYPQKSAIRELVSNALDSIREKQIALEIISGKAKVEDYYITRHDALNRDSNFDEGYYDLKWLLTDPRGYNGIQPDNVYVTYEEGAGMEKDRVVIEDFGVGMGAERLEGYFRIGYSTKRNTKQALGKFGIGAKAGLSTAPYYLMISRYNGREYQFMVYAHTIQPIVPQFNMETMQANGLHLFRGHNGKVVKVYYKETKMPNGVRIELESKKHHKQLYIDAVKSQLLYFPNVEFRIRNQAGGLDIVPIQAKIIYEDDSILLSDNNQYSKPHVLISRVNYGYVDFKELELEDVQGNIAFKIPAEEVTIKPSRESLVWNEQTRAAIMSYFKKVKATAEGMISDQLKVEDFIEWIEACSRIKARYAVDSVVGRLSQLVDLSNAKIAYVKDPAIFYGPGLFSGLSIRVNELKTVREGSVVKYKIERSSYGIIQALADGLPIYVQQGKTSFKIDKYLLMGPRKDKGFITIADPFTSIDENGNMSRGTDCPSGPLIEEAVKEILHSRLTKMTVTMADVAQHGPAAEKEVKARMYKVIDYLMKSSQVQWYNKVVVPDDFDEKEEVEDQKTIEEVKAKAEREKMKREKGVIPIFTPRNTTSSYISGSTPTKLYEWQKIEMPVTDIDSWDEEEVFFGNDKDQELLQLAAVFTRPTEDLTYSPLANAYLSYRNFDSQPDRWKDFVKVYFSGTVNTNSSQPYFDLGKPKPANPTGYVHYNLATHSNYNTTLQEAARCHNFFRTNGQPKVKLVKVAMDRVKFFLDFKPIQRFFMDIKGKTLTMSNALIRWNTARMIQEHLSKLRFLNNFDRFHSKYAQWYRQLVVYADTYYRDVATHAASNKYVGVGQIDYQSIVSHMDKVTRFQLFVRQNPEPEKIAELAKEMFNPQQEINDGLAIDLQIYDMLQELLDFSTPIRTLLNDMTRLQNNGADIPEELEHEIRFYITSKDVTL